MKVIDEQHEHVHRNSTTTWSKLLKQCAHPLEKGNTIMCSLIVCYITGCTEENSSSRISGNSEAKAIT